MKPLTFALALAAAGLLTSATAAQVSQGRTVDAYVSVVDSKGDPVKGLTDTDFRVREDGVVREVRRAGLATDLMTIALLVDDSQALSPAIQMVREALDG